MAVGIVAVSTSGPLMAAIVAPALAVALWRNVLAVIAIWPVALVTRRPELGRLTRHELTWATGAGVLLALHFATWVPSLRYTSVASATAIVATQPVWVALIARASGHDIPRRAWLGIAVSLFAVIVLTGVDFSLDPQALIGDLLALLGGVFAALYTVAGRRGTPDGDHDDVHRALLLDRCRRTARAPASSAASSSGVTAARPGCSCSRSPSARSCSGTRCSTWCCGRPARRSSRSRCCSRSRARP